VLERAVQGIGDDAANVLPSECHEPARRRVCDHGIFIEAVGPFVEAFLGSFPVLVGLEKGAFLVAVGFEAGFPEVGEEPVCVLSVGEPALDID
jgi:hypothetical protein